MGEPTTTAAAIALALVLAKVIEKLIEHVISKRKNGSGNGGKGSLARDERDMLRSLFEWKDRAEQQDKEMLEKMTMISVSCRATAEAIERLVDKVSKDR